VHVDKQGEQVTLVSERSEFLLPRGFIPKPYRIERTTEKGLDTDSNPVVPSKNLPEAINAAPDLSP
jgi:hypothetical protein